MFDQLDNSAATQNFTTQIGIVFDRTRIQSNADSSIYTTIGFIGICSFYCKFHAGESQRLIWCIENQEYTTQSRVARRSSSPLNPTVPSLTMGLLLHLENTTAIKLQVGL